MLDGQAIQQRRTAYALCIADAGECLRRARVHGRKAELQRLEERLWLLIWARHVLCSYKLNGETCEAQWCPTDEDALCAMRLADPGCVICACESPYADTTPPASPCTQPTSLHIVVPPGEIIDNIVIDVSDDFDGHFMIEGDPTVHASDDFDVSLSSGEYCLYTTDGSGVPNGAAAAIYISADSLTTLDVSAWTAATYIELSADSLTTLDVSAWTAATFISLNANGLTTLDVSAWTAATSIYITADSLTTLDVSAWTAATNIYLYANSLTTLDVSSVLATVTVVAASGCPLDQASVDAILAAAVANPAITAALINLNGSCAAPSTAGYADKATLISRGCTVYTN